MRHNTQLLAVFWLGLVVMVIWARLGLNVGLGMVLIAGSSLLLQAVLAGLGLLRQHQAERNLARRMAVNWLESTRTHLYRRRPYRWSR